MYSKFAIICFLLLCISLIQSESMIGKEQKCMRQTLKKLLDKVFGYQVLKEQSNIPLIRWYEKRGLFRSEIRLNFHGGKLAQHFRDSNTTLVYDNDMFSSGWILTALLEAKQYGKDVPEMNSHRVELALDAINDFHDRNEANYSTSLIRAFWPQFFNETYDLWQIQPINVRNLVLNTKTPISLLEKVFEFLHLKNTLPFFEKLKSAIDSFASIFGIPPDFDDTYLNLGLGALLAELNQTFSTAYSNWLSTNRDMKRLVNLTLAYAYNPFSNDTNSNLIDPRTFFYAREFIQKANRSNESLSLFSTWIQNLDEQRVLHKKGISMPFNINNVDITVAANVIYGITHASLVNLNRFESLLLRSNDLIQTYLNSTRFLSWTIASNFSSRPELASLYYPSKYNLLWYASRTLFLIENKYKIYDFMLEDQMAIDLAYVNRLNRLKDIIQEAKSYLQPVFENEVSLFLYKNSVRVSPDRTYFREFLGLNDTDRKSGGHQVSSDEDALFCTAQAINIILSTWTYQRPDIQRLVWKSAAPQYIKDLVNTSAEWLLENLFNGQFRPLNAFFSGSDKGSDTVPFWYPVNFAQYFNGTNVDPSRASHKNANFDELFNGVRGVIDEDKYQDLLKQTHYGQRTPLDFRGYNAKESIFPFWSSEPYTYAVSLLALAKVNNLQ